MATVKKSKKKIIVPICIVLVIAIIAGVAFGAVKAKSSEAVSLYTIGAEDIYESVSLTGDVTSGSVKEYKVATVATVKEVFVKVGDKVNKGDVLATFNVENLDSQIKSLQSSYNDSLSSYNASVNNQKAAKKKANELASQINATESKIERLKNSTPTTTKKATTKKATTAKATTKPSTKPTKPSSKPSENPSVESSSEKDTSSTTKPAVNPGESIGQIADALIELNKTLGQITDDLHTLSTMTEIIVKTITEAIESGEFDSDVIAQKVGDALGKAVQDGIIDAAHFIVDSGLAIEMVEAAISSIDFEAISTSLVNSQNVSLTAAELQLAAQYAQYTIYNAQADDSIVNAQKKSVDAQKQALDALKQQKEDMENGWIAAFDGTITEVDITEGMQTTALSTGIKLENLDSMAVTVSLGEYDLHKVRVGMSAKITTAYGSYDGEVISIAPTATGGSSGGLLDSVGSMAGISGLSSLTASGAGVECVISIPETDENITVGFDADVEIETGEYLGVTAVPIESIKLEKTGSYVYLYNEEDDTVTKTLIETGAVSDSVYEVKSGLKAGDKIIAAPAADYEDDTFKVKVTTK